MEETVRAAVGIPGVWQTVGQPDTAFFPSSFSFSSFIHCISSSSLLPSFLSLSLSVSPVSVSLARTHTALKKKKVVIETKGKEKLRQTPASTSPVAW